MADKEKEKKKFPDDEPQDSKSQKKDSDKQAREAAGAEQDENNKAHNDSEDNDKESRPHDSDSDEQKKAESDANQDEQQDSADDSAGEADEDASGAEDDYGEEYYYDDFYTESNDENLAESEQPKEDAGDSGGPIIPDDPEDQKKEEPEPKKKGKKKKIDEKKMPFLDHLEELRWTLLRSLTAVFIGAIICFIFSKQIVDFLRLPSPDDLKLIYLSPTEGFMIYIKVALFSGLVVALPYVAYEFWKFIVPGLLEQERKLVPPIVFFTVLCFLIGGAFAYLVIIPFAMSFLLGFQTEYLEATLTIGKYLGFVVTLILVFGVVFELPVLAFFLSKIGLLTPDFLRSKRRYSLVTIFILAALLTPPDVMTQIMLAVPLIVLYEVSIFVSAIVVRRKKEDDDD